MSDTLAVGRIGWWRFTNGDLTDQSGNGRDLVCFGTQIPSAVDKDGIADNAINMFTYRYYKTNDLTHPLFEVSEWSICMWVNFRNLVDVEGFLTIYSDGGGSYGAWFAESSSSMRVNGTSITRPQNGWHFIIWERLSTGFCRFYIDGVVHNISQSLSIPANSNDLVFGKRGSIPYTFPNADFDEISMYSRVLTAEEKTELFTRGVNYTATPITVISSLPSGTYTAPQTIELSCATEGAEIRFLMYIKGEEPAIEDIVADIGRMFSHMVYRDSEPLEALIEYYFAIYAQAWKDGVAISEVTTFEYDILAPVTPIITPTKYIQPPKITIKNNIVSIQSQYIIYYTTNGSYPNNTSAQYTEPFILPQDTHTITAIAYSESQQSFSHLSQQTLPPPQPPTIYSPQ